MEEGERDKRDRRRKRKRGKEQSASVERGRVCVIDEEVAV